MHAYEMAPGDPLNVLESCINASNIGGPGAPEPKPGAALKPAGITEPGAWRDSSEAVCSTAVRADRQGDEQQHDLGVESWKMSGFGVASWQRRQRMEVAIRQVPAAAVPAPRYVDKNTPAPLF